MNEKLTQFFQQHYNWTPPWSRIKLIKGGWFLPISDRLSNVWSNAALLALPWGYEIHWRELPEWVLCHELVHIWQNEREPYWWMRNAMEQMRVGYKRNRYEVEARRVAEEYWQEYRPREGAF